MPWGAAMSTSSYVDEKLPLVSDHSLSPSTRPPRSFRAGAVWFIGMPLLLIFLWVHSFLTYHPPIQDLSPTIPASSNKLSCDQVDPLFPSKKSKELDDMEEFIKSEKFRNETIERLSGAVRIPTQSYDDMGEVGEDPRWDIHAEFAAYLKKTFPVLHDTLSLETVNEHGLLYTWKGSNSTLKPTLLMAHQDVVPVASSTINQWTHPPFSGHYDGKFIWGRGASDCKNVLIGQMEAIELLVQAGFEPKRTVLLSYGFDEEISGTQGAGTLAPFIHQRYGDEGIAVIVDEGAGITTAWGREFAVPGVAEKGYIDVEITVRFPGGHSSVPPDVNGIGVISELITSIQSNRYEPRLYEGNPFLGLLQCGADFAPSFPTKLKKLLPTHDGTSSNVKDALALEAAKAGASTKYLFTTSIAPDVITGGVKVNALPERTTVLINHRVNIGSSPSDVKAKITTLSQEIGSKYNLQVIAFNTSAPETPSSIILSNKDTILEPAPITPTISNKASAWTVLSGTTRGLYGEDMIIAPGLTTGNTDTRYYWGVTRNIFRFVPGFDKSAPDGLKGGIHTVDERVSVLAHVRGVEWFGAFLRNMDEVDI